MTSIHRKVSPFVPFDDPRDAPAYSVSESPHDDRFAICSITARR
jgi:hypothetical protein